MVINVVPGPLSKPRVKNAVYFRLYDLFVVIRRRYIGKKISFYRLREPKISAKHDANVFFKRTTMYSYVDPRKSY